MTRTIPKTLEAVIALQDHLRGINKADGYNYDLGERVLRNRSLIGEQEVTNLPMISIIQAPRAEVSFYAGDWKEMRRGPLTLLIQGIALDDKTENTQDDAYYLCNDVERHLARITARAPGRPSAMYPNEFLLGGKITDIEISAPVIRPPEAQVSAYHFFYLPVRLTLANMVGE